MNIDPDFEVATAEMVKRAGEALMNDQRVSVLGSAGGEGWSDVASITKNGRIVEFETGWGGKVYLRDSELAAIVVFP